MRLITIVVFLALLMVPCIAVQDSVTTGPYKISFDLGLPKEAYSVTISDPKEQESLSGEKSIKYEISIKNETGVSRLASFTLTQGEIKTLMTTDEMQAVMVSYLSEIGLRDIETAQREIDKKTGAIATGDMRISGLDFKMYQASYFPFKDTTVFITSAYPWDEGTLQLLKTIHIEKINGTS